MTGLTPREAEVMDLWDAGCTVREIALCTGKSIAGTEAIISTYAFEGADHSGDAAIRRGSEALGAAVRAAR